MYTEELDLSVVVEFPWLGVRVVGVRATRAPDNCTVQHSTCLALNTGQRPAIVDHQVVACVLAERHKNRETGFAQREHDRELCSITDVLWMIHWNDRARSIGWAVSKIDNVTWATMGAAPE